MYEFIQKNYKSTLSPILEQNEHRSITTIKTSKSTLSKRIKKKRLIEYRIQATQTLIKQKLRQMEDSIDKIILEDSQSQESQRQDFLDDRKPNINTWAQMHKWHMQNTPWLGENQINLLMKSYHLQARQIENINPNQQWMQIYNL